MAYARPYRGLFIFSVILTIVLGGLGTARPILIRSVIDDAILQFNSPELVRLMILLRWIIGSGSIGSIWIYVCGQLAGSEYY